MLDTATIKVTIEFIDSALDAEDKDVEVQNFLSQIRLLEGVSAFRTADLAPPSESKSIGGFLVGKLTAEINGTSTRKVFQFIGKRLSRKPIELEVETNSRKLKVRASTPEEMERAVQQAMLFLG